MRRSSMWSKCLALSLLALGLNAFAAGYPEKPIRMIVPWSPGGGSDVTGRIIGAKLSEALGQQIVIDNRPGAAGNIGTAMAARTEADGYTLLLADTGFSTGSSKASIAKVIRVFLPKRHAAWNSPPLWQPTGREVRVRPRTGRRPHRNSEPRAYRPWHW